MNAQTDRRGVHHPRQLPTADDPYGDGPPIPHPRKRTGHYDGRPLRRLEELAAGASLMSRLPFASDEGGESGGRPSECNQHRWIDSAHWSLKITERCTMKLTVVATPWAITNAMI